MIREKCIYGRSEPNTAFKIYKEGHIVPIGDRQFWNGAIHICMGNYDSLIMFMLEIGRKYRIQS